MSLTEKSALTKDQRTGLAPMQHRHYAAIAAIIATLPDAHRRDVAFHFALKLQSTNNAFDSRRFLLACGE
jgi:hypothetical protein